MSESTQAQTPPPSATPQTAPKTRRRRRWLYALAVLFVLVALFGLLGYFWLPGFARVRAETMLTEMLHRPVSIERIAFNPYTLKATVQGFRIGEKSGGGDLLRFDSLYVNVSSASIFRAAPIIREVTLKTPQVHLAREADGRLNISDLIEEFSGKPETTKPDDKPVHFSVSNIRLEGGDFVFDDKLRKSRQHIGNINLGIPFIANFKGDQEVWVEPSFSAQINGNAPIHLGGKARPFADHKEAAVDVNLDGFDLTGIGEYIPDMGGIKLRSGLLDANLKVAFSQPADKPETIAINGDVALRRFGLDNAKGLPWKLGGDRLTLHLKNLDPLLTQPIDANVDAANVRFKQGDQPELLLATLSLADTHLNLNAGTVAFKLAAADNQHGRLDAAGSVGWKPLAVDLTLDANQLDLIPMQGFFFQHPTIVATRGAFNFKGSVKVGGNPLNTLVKGNASLDDLYVLDKKSQDDLLRWKNLNVTDIDVKTEPLNVNIKSIVSNDLFARVTIMPDGELRLKDVLKEQGGAAAKTPAEPAPPQAADKAKSAGSPGGATVAAKRDAPLPINIGEVSVNNGNVIYNDLFIKPHYRANLTQLNGRIGPLVPGKRGNVLLKGSVNHTAPLAISGKVDPFGSPLFLDIEASVRGIDMADFSPYSGRYLGYAIEKGKFSADVKYYIEKNQLRAENRIILDQLTLGQKMDSPDALSAPIGLAIALLKDSSGVIDLELPLTGSLDDPQFSVGGLIVTVLKNLIVKAATSPFTLLSSVFGGGSDLSQVAFAAGRASLTPDADKELASITKAMTDRPTIKIEATGVADSAKDAPELKRATMERHVRAQKLAELAKQGQSGGSIDTVQMSDAEFPKYLEMAYKAETFDKPKNVIGMTKSLSVAEMEQLMIANMPAGEEELRALASHRARAVAQALIDRGVPTERVFVMQPRVETSSDDKKAGRVEFSLR